MLPAVLSSAMKRRSFLLNVIFACNIFCTLYNEYSGLFVPEVQLDMDDSQPQVVFPNRNLLSLPVEGNATLSNPCQLLVSLPVEETVSNQTYPSDSKKLPSVAIFLHIYVPKEEDITRADHVKRATRIIHQQLKHVSEGVATVQGIEPLALYYTTVGRELQPGYVDSICRNHSKYFHCNHLQHLDRGFEEHTLGAMYEHCQEYNDDRVIYLHTKGSYHSSKAQARWRRHMTDAVAGHDCVEQAHNKDCDLCGLLFLPRPSLHFTGNMFNAKCRYIQKLTHPEEFQEKMVKVDTKARDWMQQGILQSNMLNVEEPWNAGIDRFAMEHWHGSHPSAQKICDVSNGSRIQYWQQIRAMDRNPGDWEFGIFPRHPSTADWSHGRSDRIVDSILANEAKRKRE